MPEIKTSSPAFSARIFASVKENGSLVIELSRLGLGFGDDGGEKVFAVLLTAGSNLIRFLRTFLIPKATD